jgi:hypothetical protein
MTWAPIRYRDFYDIPRAFVVERDGSLFFFDCGFEQRIDDYPDRIRVYRLPSTPAETLDKGSWEGLASLGAFVGEVPTSAVKFDGTKRVAIDDSVFDLL